MQAIGAARLTDVPKARSLWVTENKTQKPQGPVACAMLGIGSPFLDVPFFWSQHCDVQMFLRVMRHPGTYLKSWEAPQRGNACVVYRTGRRVMAVTTIARDGVNLAAEAALEQSLESILNRQQ